MAPIGMKLWEKRVADDSRHFIFDVPPNFWSFFFESLVSTFFSKIPGHDDDKKNCFSGRPVFCSNPEKLIGPEKTVWIITGWLFFPDAKSEKGF